MSRKSENVECYLVSYYGPEIHAEQSGNLERREVSKIEDRVPCQRCPRKGPGETFCGCGSLLQGITKKVDKQTEQRISSRYIMYVPGIHDLELKQTQREQQIT